MLLVGRSSVIKSKFLLHSLVLAVVCKQILDSMVIVCTLHTAMLAGHIVTLLASQ